MVRRPREHFDAPLMGELEISSRWSQFLAPCSTADFTPVGSQRGVWEFRGQPLLTECFGSNKNQSRKRGSRRRTLAAVIGEYFIYGAVFPQGAMAAA